VNPPVRALTSFCGGLFLSLVAIFADSARAGDWPQFLGPHRNGVSDESVTTNWPSDGPKIRWRQKTAKGFSGPVVIGDKVILFSREGDEEILICRETAKGGKTWEQRLPTAYVDDFGFDEGPRATPAVADGKVFAIGAAGQIRCVSLADGGLLWKLNAAELFRAEKGFFGFACSPVVLGDKVIFQVGGNGGTLVALETKSGKLLWKFGSDEAGYASPLVAEFGKQTRIVSFHREGLSILDPESGKETFRFPWRSRMNASVNAASPLVDHGRVFLTASYGTGAVLLAPVGNAFESTWSGYESLSAHFVTPVICDGFLYGYHGRTEEGPELRCVELATGKVRWRKEGFGSGSVTLAGHVLILVRESGELDLADASPDAFRVLAQTQAAGSGARALPALANGCLYVRDKNQLTCLEVR
jgi:outer membrane protein assembly factor BamB